MESTRNSTPKGVWRFGLALVVFCACEAVALLVGFERLQSDVFGRPSSLLFPLFMAASVCGSLIEQWLRTLSGRQPSSDREFMDLVTSSTVRGFGYGTAIAAAYVGWIVHWAIALSIVIFVCLMARSAWIWTRRHGQDRTSE